MIIVHDFLEFSYSFPDAFASLGGAALVADFSVLTQTVDGLLQIELLENLFRRHGLGLPLLHVLFIREHQNRGIAQVSISAHLLQLLPHLGQFRLVGAVHHKYYGVNFVKVMSPEPSGLPTDIP